MIHESTQPHRSNTEEMSYLHPLRHCPPLSHFRICPHTLHGAFRVRTEILDRSEERAVIIEKDGIQSTRPVHQS